MDENSNREITGLLERGNKILTRGEEERTEDGELLLDRRSYLAAAGLTTAAVAGCADLDSGQTVQPVSSFGYGGGPVLQQTSSLTVSESEPNDRQGNADAISLGATVSGTLAVSDTDWYLVDASAGDDIAVEFSRQAASGVTAVILYSPDGTFHNLKYVASDDPVTVAGTAETSGNHFVQVVDTQNSDGDYTMTVGGTLTTPTPTAEPTETATPVATETATSDEDDYGEQGYGEYGYGGIAT